MKTFSKTLFATVAGLAVVAGGASPAAAQERHRDRGDRISTSDVITGALIIGGIAVVAAAVDNDRDRDYRDQDYRDRDYRDRDYRDQDYRDDDYRGGRNGGQNGGWYNYGGGRNTYRGGGNPDRAVAQCIRAAEREAERWGGGRAEVTQLRDVDRERNGFEVRGSIAVRSNNNRNGSWGNYRRGYRNNGFDTGAFSCEFRRGQVVDIDFSGLRGL